MTDYQTDTLFSNRLNKIVDFSFDESVAGVFPDMIQRSVPGYSTLISMIGVLAGEYAQDNSRCYDLGCSVGAVTLSVRRRIQRVGCTVVAVDNSEAMVEHCRVNIANDDSPVPVELHCLDLADVTIHNASVVILNYTLQFIPLALRDALILKIYEGMRPGAVLILSEKIAFSGAESQARNIDLHHAFKRANGYSELEISQKRSMLENVLVPETEGAHLSRIKKAGFPTVETWYQCLNFISMLAIK